MRSGPPIVVVAVAIALAGCAGGNFGVRAGDAAANHGSPPPGTSYAGAAVRAELSTGAYLGMAFFGAVVLGLQDDAPRGPYRTDLRQLPALDAGRAVAERDCSQPLGPLVENLRCK